MLNKNSFPYLTQSDPRWGNEIMTAPEWQEKPDLIKDFFCLNTSFLNIYNDYYKQSMTPSQLNKMIIAKDGYKYLIAKKKYRKMDDVINSCINKESYVDIPTVLDILNISSLERNYNGEIDIKNPSVYYIIKVPYKETGHYCNIIAKDKRYFDVYDGKTKAPSQILEIIKVNL